MLTAQDNDLLTLTGPDQPMGQVFRQYWLSVLLSKELSPDGPPQRLGLLGEDGAVRDDLLLPRVQGLKAKVTAIHWATLLLLLHLDRSPLASVYTFPLNRLSVSQ